MQSMINTFYTWLERRKQRRWRRLIEKHYLIAKTGSTIRAKAINVYQEKGSFKKIRMVHIQLRIDFLDGVEKTVVSKCLLHNYLPIEGKMIRCKFLPGDLSQIVLCQ
jgi:hypothetical protein